MLILAFPCTSKAADIFGYLVSQAILLLTYTITLALEMNYLFLPKQDLAGRLLKSLGFEMLVLLLLLLMMVLFLKSLA